MSGWERAVGSLRRAIQVVADGGSLGGDGGALAGVRAAALARNVAAGRLRDYAGQARAQGHSWEAIADALGVDHDGPGTRGERVYLYLIEGRPLHPDTEGRGHRGAAQWRCGSCEGSVTDRGPFEAAPYNNEDGHAPDCARHTAEIAAYHRREDRS